MDNSAQWPQGFGVVKGVDNPSSSGSIDQQQKRSLARPQKDQIVNCPRCNSVNTKFCYYNNYSLSQPRYFCKTCRRYWTAGGSLRNVPVGGGSRKNRRSSSSTTTSVAPSSVLTASAVHAQTQAAAAVVANTNTLHHQGGHDLNLSFPPHPTTTTTHDHDLHRHHQYLNPNPTFTTTTTTTKHNNFSIDHLSNSKLLPHHPNPISSNMTPLLPPMGLFNNSLLSHDHSSREILMSSLMNPPEHHHHTNNNPFSSSIFSSAAFPTIVHQDDQFIKPSSLNFSLDGFSSDHHDGYDAASSLQLGVHQQQNSDGNVVGGARLLFPFNQQENNKDHQKQIPTASEAASNNDVVAQFDQQQHNINRSSSTSVQGGGTGGGDHNNGSSAAGFWTGMLSGGSW